MVTNGFSMVYLGEFSQDVTLMFASMTENDMEKRSEEKSTKKKVFHVLVEALQNLYRHSDEFTDNDLRNGLFIIGKKDDRYNIITSNKVAKIHKPNLENALNQVNSATKSELKEMYTKQISEGKISNRGGAGLGLIDIARKTGEKLKFQFLDLNDDYYFFILEVEVNATKGSKEIVC